MPDTEKEALCARIDELCAENERLRQELREYQATIDSLVDECTDHKAENAKLREWGQDGGFWRLVTQDDGTLGLLWDDSIGKELEEHGWVHKDEYDRLRELVLDMRTCIDHACMCEFCPLFASEDMGELRCIADVKAHMRELGLEVDG